MPAADIDLRAFLSQTAVAPSDPQIAAMMADLQGNILKGPGRSHTLHLFFRFATATPLESLREWLLGFVQDHVTTALEQFEETARFRETGEPGALFCNLLLTHHAYVALQVAEEETPPDASFRAGMPARRQVLADPPAEQWESGYQQGAGAEIHGMILLADSDPDTLTHEGRRILESAGTPPLIELLKTERGRGIFNQRGDAIEHFGYIDGRSQPLFLAKDVEKEATRCGGTYLWDPSAPLALALVDDPASPNPLGFGSYFVFRKLEQNVAGFKVLEEALGVHLAAAAGQPVGELAGALVVGRHEDGTPVTLQATDGLNRPITNNFNYDNDPGVRCPFHAHIRKANPRTEETRERRVVRRGITYGERDFIGEENGLCELPAGGVGLLFMCFQANLAKQFEFIQARWANSVSFPEPLPLGGFARHGIDPIIGQFDGIQPVPPEQIGATDLPSPSQPWPARYGCPAPAAQAPFWGFVKLLGGDYFFAPSLSGLLALLVPKTEPGACPPLP